MRLVPLDLPGLNRATPLVSRWRARIRSWIASRPCFETAQNVLIETPKKKLARETSPCVIMYYKGTCITNSGVYESALYHLA